MNFNRKLITGLFGLALIAAPITAAAKDDNGAHQQQAQPSHSNESHGGEAHHQEQASHNAGREQHAAQPQRERLSVRLSLSARLATRAVNSIRRPASRVGRQKIAM